MALPKSQSIRHFETPVENPPDEWITKTPLRLLAWALDGMPQRTGKVGDIKAALQDLVEPTRKWKVWWDLVRPMVDDADEFKRSKTGITLLANEITDVPAYPLPTKILKAAPHPRQSPPSRPEVLKWSQWFEGKEDALPSKSGYPVKAAYDAIKECPPWSINPALHRIIQSSEDFLASGKPSKGAAEGWAQLLSQAALRLRSRYAPYDDATLPGHTAQLMAQLVEIAAFPRATGHWLCQAGALPAGQPETWRTEFASGLWNILPRSRHDIRIWFDKAFAQTAARDRAAIASEIALAAFTVGGSPISPARIDGLLAPLRAEDKSVFLRNLIVRSAAGKTDQRSALDYVVHSQNELSHAQITLGAMAAVLLPDTPTPLTEHAAQKIAQSLNDPGGSGDPAWDALLSASRQHIAALRANWQSDLNALQEEMDNQQHSYETRLAERADLVARLRAEIAAGREESRMDIRQDMLIVISETLQSLRQKQHDPVKMLQLVTDRLRLALRAGGGEEFGRIGEAVDYDPVRHRADEPIVTDTPVRILLPGAMVKGKSTSGRILVKARVAVRQEDT